jgi:hypothetical protein
MVTSCPCSSAPVASRASLINFGTKQTVSSRKSTPKPLTILHSFAPFSAVFIEQPDPGDQLGELLQIVHLDVPQLRHELFQLVPVQDAPESRPHLLEHRLQSRIPQPRRQRDIIHDLLVRQIDLVLFGEILHIDDFLLQRPQPNQQLAPISFYHLVLHLEVAREVELHLEGDHAGGQLIFELADHVLDELLDVGAVQHVFVGDAPGWVQRQKLQLEATNHWGLTRGGTYVVVEEILVDLDSFVGAFSQDFLFDVSDSPVAMHFDKMSPFDRWQVKALSIFYQSANLKIRLHLQPQK